MARRGPHEVPGDRKLWTFGDALRWHLFVWGTRPKGTIESPGRQWRLEEFASEIGRTPRAVENWLRNSNLPLDTMRIQDVLFGASQQYQPWQIELRSLHEKAQTGDTSHTFIAPPEMPSFSGEIVGREEIFIGIRELFSKKANATQRVVVRGLGGVGKTSVAAEYMRRFGPTYDGAWWCRSETRAALISSLANLGRALQPDAQVEADVERAAKSTLVKIASEQKRWLIIYDNVASPDEMHDLLPQGGADILITSRFAFWSRWATEIELDVLSIETATSLLQQLASRRDLEGARLLADLLGKLPLAIDHAAAFCQQSGMSFVGYAHKVGDLIKMLPAGGAYPKSVHATFSLAIEAAVQKSPAAEFLMAFLSYCAPERVPMAFIDVALQPEPDPHLAVPTLAEVSLIKHDPYADGVPAVTVHRLVQEVGRSRSRDKGNARSAVNLIAVCLNSWFPRDAWNEPDAWNACEQLLPHVLAIKAVGIEPEVEDWSALLDKVGTYFYGRGSFATATALQKEATAIAQKRAQASSAEASQRLHNLASTLLESGDLDGALRQVQQALVMRPAQDFDRAATLSLYGRILHSSGKLEEARKVSEEAVQMAIASVGDDHEAVATFMNNLAIVLDALDDIDASISLDRAALAIRQRRLGGDHVEVAQSLHNLALSYVRLQEFDEALTLISRAADIKRKKFGPDHPETLVTQANRADILAHNGRLEEAERLCAATVELARKRLGATDHRTALFEVTWSDILIELDRPAEALRLSSAALGVLETENSPSTRRAAKVTVFCLRKLGQSKQADELARRYQI